VLVQAANYLNIKSLLDLTCQTVANMIKGAPASQHHATGGFAYMITGLRHCTYVFTAPMRDCRQDPGGDPQNVQHPGELQVNCLTIVRLQHAVLP